MHSLAPSRVIVGSRFRKDLGDVESLARSIAEVGLLNPITVTPSGELIAGGRRLAAWRRLYGDEPIPVHVVDLAAIVRGEAAENFERKDFTLSEAVAIRDALVPIERAAAAERMRAGRAPCGKFPQGRAGKSRDKAAALTGYSPRTLDKAAAVVAASREDPERFGRYAEDMDRTGSVDGPYSRLVAAQRGAALRAGPPPLPGRGPYHGIVADPPWPYDDNDEDPGDRGTYPYPQMSIPAICALDVASIAAADCVLWLWITNHHLLRGVHREVLDAWGFTARGLLTWGKDNRFGHGKLLRGQTEQCVLATRGKPTLTLTNESTLLLASAGRHSEKPAAFYELVERLCPASRYAELFSRQSRPNWDGHGDEAARQVAE